MKIKFLLITFALFVLSFNFVSAQSTGFYGGVGSSSFTNQQLYQPSFQTYYGADNRLGTYWPILNDQSTCNARQDFILQIAPGGCQPAVVRSDLLEDQNVPVFCQVDALQLNPLINVKEIKNIRFTGNYPSNVAGVGFHPAKAALRTNDILLGSPVINNIGYVVVVLKQIKNESSVKDVVNMTLTAQLEYQAGNAYGIGRSEYYLETSDDKTWSESKSKQSFFQGQYFVRLDDVDASSAQVSLYKGDVRITSTKVQLGKESANLFLPGFYCSAGVKVAYDGFVAKQDKARIEIRDEKGVDSFDVYKGSSFLDENCRVSDLTIKDDGSSGVLEASCYGKKFVLSLGVNDTKKKTGESNLMNKDIPNKEVLDYLDNALKTYEGVADDYPQEVKADSNGVRTYGEAALGQAIQIASDNEQFKTEVRLRNKFIELYPTSSEVENQKRIVQERLNFDYVDAVKVIDIGSKPRTVSLVRFDKVQSKDSKAKAILLIGGVQKTLKIGEEIKEGDKTVRLIYLDSSNANIDCTDKNGVKYVPTLSLRVGQSGSLCGDAKSKVSLTEIQDLDRVAKIRLIPYADNPNTQTNLSVSIGIEKRAIKLNPDKTAERIANLNQSIEKWDKISKSLGKVVTGLKSACFATAGVLTVKNFIQGAGGEALARQQAMTGSGGWTEKCSQAVARGEYGKSMTRCYNENANQINADVKARTDALVKVNNDISAVEKSGDITNKGVLESSVNVDKAKLAYAQKLKDQDLNVPTDEKTLKYITYTDLREYEYNSLLKSNTGVNQDKVTNDFNSIDKKIQASREMVSLSDQAKSANSKVLSGEGVGIIGGLPNANVARSKVYTLSADNKANGEQITFGSDLPKDSSVTFLRGSKEEYIPGSNGVVRGYSAPQNFMVVGKLDSNGILQGQKVYQIREENNQIYFDNIPPEAGDDGKDVSKFLASYKVAQIKNTDAQKYGNPIIASNQEVRYFGSGAFDGLPAIVPFDFKEGWYVNVKPVLGVGNQQTNYDKSGAPKVFDICNVGDDSAIDSRDDCQTIHVGINDNEPVLGLPADKSRTLITRARQALIEAASQKGNGVVSINGVKMRTGERMTAIAGTQCQDFMKPEDCKLLFNMCDPVVCPTSRCDFGGKYQVDNVIQTGIVGGALLCLPNAQEGIVVPVCLSGIQAGIDGYLSVMKSYRSCLQENLQTGRLIGVCDQIHSLYMCDFFWRQISPLANVLIPKVVESLYSGSIGGKPRNGGEYSNVMAAWDNTKKSVDFFTQSYAVNSLQAFQSRSINDVGAQVCKSFISSASPKALKSLVAPDSPPQFYAQFDSIKFTDATIPATAQYKVYYHIFAGNDNGVQYNVYLKNPPQSSEYISTPTIQVESGFIGKGQTVDKARDFTAPEGYKELCVMINDRNYCGFKQVTTDFGLNYLKDQYVTDQLQNTNIQNAQQCVYGTPDLKGALTNSNPQSAGEEAGLPGIYKRGIVRVCASSNPGASTSPDRYQNVGKCDDNKQCWLDKNSVSNALIDNNAVKNIGLKNETLDKLSKEQIATLGNPNLILNQNDGRIKVKADTITNKINDLSALNGVALKNKVKEIIDDINTFTTNYLFFNSHKAEFAYLKAETYKKAFDVINPKISNTNTPNTNSHVSSTLSTPSAVVENKLSLSKEYKANGDELVINLNGVDTEMTITKQDVKFNGEHIGYLNVVNSAEQNTPITLGRKLVIQLDKNLARSLGLSPDLEKLVDGAIVSIGSSEMSVSKST